MAGVRPSIGLLLSQFHVTRGNEVACCYPSTFRLHAGLHTDGLEWKVLPSGGHLVSSDVILFETPTPEKRIENRSGIGIAVFRNLRLDPAGQAPSDATGTATRSSTNRQRGARMFSASLLVLLSNDADSAPFNRGTDAQAGESPSPFFKSKAASEKVRQRIYTLALPALQHLAAEVALLLHAQPDLDLSNSTAATAGTGSPSSHLVDVNYTDAAKQVSSMLEQAHGRLTVALSTLIDGSIFTGPPQVQPLLPSHASIHSLPAQHATFGPLLLKLLKVLLPSYLPGTYSSSLLASGIAPLARARPRAPRVLIYTPSGSSKDAAGRNGIQEGMVQTACVFASNLLVLLEDIAAQNSGHLHHLHHHHRQREGGDFGLRLRGYVSVHDLVALDAEHRAANGANAEEEERGSRSGWLAVTSDAILREKTTLFDILLDLSPLACLPASATVAGGNEHAPTALPLLSMVVDDCGSESNDGGRRAQGRKGANLRLRRLNWTAREFGAWDIIDRTAEFTLQEREAALMQQCQRHRGKSQSQRGKGPAQQQLEQEAEEDNLLHVPGAMPQPSRSTPGRSARSNSSRHSSHHWVTTLFAFLHFCCAGWPTVSVLLSFIWRRQPGSLALHTGSGRANSGGGSQLALGNLLGGRDGREAEAEGDTQEEDDDVSERVETEGIDEQVPSGGGRGPLIIAKRGMGAEQDLTHVNEATLDDADMADATLALALQQAWVDWGASLLTTVVDEVLRDVSTASTVVKASAMRRAGLSVCNPADVELVRAVATSPRSAQHVSSPPRQLEFQAGWRGLFSW
ncbi:hypothetical protein K437DRAFT_190291 [Tilletiaria anomala UBC 951]|uniref:Uncharacterized protein n=1 Tax=Tilletiaria anomala (strain ATCC 24038 / CBS 436.72 / UBC 951) TaxID=1037660 RepID=A0A066VF67_TILAU|nr:uncharacterized protein K437DRAFT_190291 [Tilletiaria anomala UBC 951]KDN40352.1 hypothetical protein K437DRAFT_190291 [Tilletiaria anomala UBC 951]